MRRQLRWVACMTVAVGAGTACDALFDIESARYVDAGSDAHGKDADIEARAKDARADIGAKDSGSDVRLVDAGSDARPRDAGIDVQKPDATMLQHDSGAADATPDARELVFDGNCSCPDGSCAPLRLPGAPLPGLRFVFVDATGVYFASLSTGSNNELVGSVWSTGLDFKNTKELTADATPNGLVHAGGYVYWTEVQAVHRCGSSCADGGLETLDGSFSLPGPMAISPDASYVYIGDDAFRTVTAFPVGPGARSFVVSSNATPPVALVAGPTAVYWTGSAGIYACPLTGCTDAMAPLAYATPVGGAVAANAERIFWANSNSVGSTPLADGGLDTRDGSVRAIALTEGVSSLAVDDGSIYYSTTLGLFRVSIDGGGTTAIASTRNAGSFALSDSCVYWVSDDPDAGYLYASPK